MIRHRLQVRLLEDRLAPAIFTVMNTNDSGAGSLRQAVINANGAVGADSIVFDPTAFANPQLITLSGGQITITDAVTISGPAAKATVDAAGKSRIFMIDVLNTNVAISGLALINGSVNQFYGGGILINDGAVSLDNMSITNCTASGSTQGYGGAVGTNGKVDSLVVSNSNISGNTAGGGGGGIMVYGPCPVTFTRCTIAGNASSGGGAGVLLYSGSIFTVNECTFSGNSGNVGASSYVGGAMYLRGSTSTLRNCTISGNSAKSGGGIATTGSLTVQNCTIAYNSATASGGGIWQSGSGSVTLESTILAKNSAPSGPDCIGKMTANFCLIGSTGGAVITGSNNKVSVDPMLLPLAGNGGPTLTHLLNWDSIGIDNGSNPAGLPFDQRGASYPRVMNGTADIGAVEGFNTAPIAVSTTADVTSVGGTSQAITVTYSDFKGITVSTIGTGDITVSGPNGFAIAPSFVAVDVNTDGTPRTATYEFTPPGGTWDGNDFGKYQVTMVANQVFDKGGNAIAAGPIGSFKVHLPHTIVVTNTLGTGPGSLREAIVQANSNGGSDTILFAADVSGTIKSATGEMIITDTLTIVGPGALVITLDANKTARIFKVEANLTLSGLTLANGLSTGSKAFIAEGGAIHTSNSLTVQNCTFTGNRGDNAAGGGVGGAIFSTGPTLELSGCTLTSNSGVRGSGGIYTVTAAINVDNCFFQSNAGGGILGNNSTTITNSRFVSNSASFGGAIYTSQLLAQNCTFASNLVGGKFCYGGAIVVLNGGTLQNCTVTGNYAVGIAPGGGYAGGIDVRGGLLSIESTIISGNFEGNTSSNGPNDIRTHSFGGSSVGAKNCAIGTMSGISSFTDMGGNLPTGANLQLKISADGRHYVPAVTSPCKNAGSNPAGLLFDGRGAGYARVVGAAADIGAYEIQTPPRVTSVLVNDGQVQRSRITQLTVTLDQAFLTLPTNQATAFQLKRVSDNALVTLAKISSTRIISPPSYSITLGFTGGPLEFGSLADGVYQLTALSTIADESGQFLDGNGDGIGGDNYVSPTTPGNPNRIFRLFGDSDGDGAVAANDFIALRLAFGGSGVTFDFDNDGYVSASDFIQFRLRFGGSI